MASAGTGAGIPHSLPANFLGAGDGTLLATVDRRIAGAWPFLLLLRALAPDDYALLQPHLEPVTLPLKAPLFDPNEPIERVYFLDDGVASIVSVQEGGRPVEIGIHGREGMSGVPVVLGADRSPHASMIQVGDAPAQGIASERLLDACDASPALNQLLLRYAHTLNVQTALTAAANATYELPERCARWLLMCNDSLESDRIELTHEFLSMMLAVHRSGVTVTLHELQETGAIHASRGVIRFSTSRVSNSLREIAMARRNQRLIAPFGGVEAPANAC